MVIRKAAFLALNVSCWTGVAHATPPACHERLLPPTAPAAAAGQRALSARDLVELRDFGRLDDGPGRPPFRISPDHRHAVLALRRADADGDSYCVGLVLVSLRGGQPRLLDVGGEPIPAPSDMHGLAAIPTGVFRDASPLWSPDGRSIAYLRRDGRVTQIWLVNLDGEPARQLSRLDTEALSLAWTADGSGLIFSTRRGLDAAREQFAAEGAAGYSYDERFWSLADSHPHPPAGIPVEDNLLVVATGDVRPLGAGEAAALKSSPTREGAILNAVSGDARAWVAPDDAERPASPTRLHVEIGGKTVSCTPAFCSGPIAGLWWQGADLLILRGGSAANGGRVMLYRWRPDAQSAPRLLFETTDWLTGCELDGAALVCSRESATRPRFLERIDLGTGTRVTLFDPNPELAGVALGRVQRLGWRDINGVQSYGDLVLPPTHRPGDRHPLIVVQYWSRGFLRGGMGDEYPLHLFANRGYAVLSFQMPGNAPEVDAEPDWNRRQALKVKGWAGRRRMFTSLDAGIDAAVATGAVDKERIGITGMSDGSSTVQFALLHSTRFKAAAVSTCCDDPSTVFSVGPSYTASARAWGYPGAGTDGRDFWREQSLVANADRLRTPLLMQLPDGEFRMAAEAHAALKSRGAPVDMYVFPDEWHTKGHPAHRLAIYRRNLAWFDFWLRGIDTPETGRPGEIERWRLLRARLPARE